MSQKNMGRLAQDMKRELIAIIGRLKDPRLEGGLLTVTRLDVTPDLDVAKVYVSVMGREDGPKPAIEALNRAAGHVRTEVSKKMHIRKAPRFIFVEDDGAAYAAHINELLRSLNLDKYRMLVYAIVLILVMIATNNAAIRGFFAQLKSRLSKKDREEQKGGAAQ